MFGALTLALAEDAPIPSARPARDVVITAAMRFRLLIILLLREFSIADSGNSRDCRR
jgi:hypothetical protein